MPVRVSATGRTRVESPAASLLDALAIDPALRPRGVLADGHSHTALNGFYPCGAIQRNDTTFPSEEGLSADTAGVRYGQGATPEQGLEVEIAERIDEAERAARGPPPFAEPVSQPGMRRQENWQWAAVEGSQHRKCDRRIIGVLGPVDRREDELAVCQVIV